MHLYALGQEVLFNFIHYAAAVHMLNALILICVKTAVLNTLVTMTVVSDAENSKTSVCHM